MRRRRWLAWLLASAMLVTNVPEAAFAAELSIIDDVDIEADSEAETVNNYSDTSAEDIIENDVSAGENKGDGYDITNGLTDEQLNEIIGSAVYMEYTPDEDELEEGLSFEDPADSSAESLLMVEDEEAVEAVTEGSLDYVEPLEGETDTEEMTSGETALDPAQVFALEISDIWYDNTSDGKIEIDPSEITRIAAEDEENDEKPMKAYFDAGYDRVDLSDLSAENTRTIGFSLKLRDVLPTILEEETVLRIAIPQEYLLLDEQESVQLPEDETNEPETNTEIKSENGTAYDVQDNTVLITIPAETVLEADKELVSMDLAATLHADHLSAIDTTEANIQINDLIAGQIVLPANDDPEVKNVLSWEEYYAQEISKYDLDSMSEQEIKNLYVYLRNSYIVYRDTVLAEIEAAKGSDGDAVKHADEQTEQYAEGEAGSASQKRAYAYGMLENDYIEAAIYDTGAFTIGNKKGDPDYDSDDGQKLIYGHPSSSTSETLIRVNGIDHIFTADSIFVNSNNIVAVMNIQDESVTVTEELTLVKSGKKNYEDAVNIHYTVQNTGSSEVSVGVRIMLDTMLANNDHAPFKVPGTGNLTTQKTYTGSDVPTYYQVYDNLDNPSTLATGYLKNSTGRTPDKVQFANWGGINGSSWEYSNSEGSDLGDSAVGIYFNEVTLSPGNSTAVSTQYGVGLGTKSGLTDNISVGADEVAFRIQDLTTGDPVEDATLTMEDGTTYTTQANGFAVVKLVDVDGKKVTVSKDGYQSKEETSSREGGRKYTIKIKKNGDDTPEIKSVMLNSTDLLKNAKMYTQDASSLISSAKYASQVTPISIKVTCDTADCTYYLMQDGQTVLKNDNGVFTLKTLPGHGKDYDYIEKLSPDKKIYVRVVTEKGAKATEEVLLKVMSPTLAFDFSKLSKSTYSLVEEPSWANAGNLLLQIVAGGDSKIKLGADSKNKITYKLDVPGRSLKVGLNTKLAQFVDNKTAVREFKNGSEHTYSSKKRMTDAEKKRYKDTIERWQDKKTKYKVGQFSVDMNFMGYGEFFWDEDGEMSGNMYVAVSINGTGSATTHFAVWIIPMYATLGWEGKGEVAAKTFFSGFSDGDKFMQLLNNLAVELSFYIGGYGEIGAGDGNVAKIGGKLKAGYNRKHNFSTSYYKNSIDGELSLEAKALLWEKSMKIASASWTLSEGYYNNGTSSKSNARKLAASSENEIDYMAELMAQPTQMSSRDYLTLEETAEDAEVYRADNTTETTMTNVYTEAQPKLVRVGNKQYRFWLQDITSREPQNRTALVYAVNTGSGWSDYTVIEDDGTADFAFDTCILGDDLYVVWQDCNAVFDSTVDLMSMGQGLDITMAKINGQSDLIEQRYSVTADQTLDQAPAICALSDTVYVAWNSTQSSFFEEVKGSKLNYRSLANGVLSNIETKELGNKSLENLQLVEDGGVVKAIYSLVEWEDALIRKSQQTNMLTLTDGILQEGIVAAAGSIPVAADLQGEQYMFWYQDGNINYKPLGTDAYDTKAVFADGHVPASLSANFILVNATDKTYLIWSGTEDTENEYARKYAYTITYADGKWGEVYKLTELSDGTIQSLSGTTKEDGTLTLSWMNVAYDEEGKLIASDINTKEVGGQDSYKELSIVDLEYDELGASVNEEYNFKVTLKNNGSTAIDNATVAVHYDGGYDEEQGRSFDDFYTTIPLTELGLEPGSSIEKEVTIVVPETGKHEYVVDVTPEGQNDVTGTDEFVIGQTTLTIEDRGSVMDSEGEGRFVEVANVSHVPATNVRIRLFDSGEDGAMLYENNLGDIEGDSSKCVTIPVSAFESSTSTFACVYTDTYMDTTAVIQQISNTNHLIRTLDNRKLTIVADEGGSITGDYQDEYLEEEEVSVSAEPNEGYAFWSWENSVGEVADPWAAETTYTMPYEDAELHAVFKPIKAPEELSVQIPETLTVGDDDQLSIVVSPADTSEHTHITSTDESVVKVSDDGKIKVVGAGTAEITVTCGDKTVQKTVTAEPRKIEAIQIAGPVYIDGVGKTEAMMPQLTPENASEEIIWSSSAPEIVSIDEKGTAKALEVGSAVITARAASDEAVMATCEVHVEQHLQGLSISNTSLNLLSGETQDISVSFLPEKISDVPEIKWEVSDSSGTILVTAVDEEDARIIHITAGDNPGTVLLRATANGVESGYCQVKVEVPVKRIDLTADTVDIRKGDNCSILSSIEPSNTTDTLSWTSSDSSIAAVNGDGLVTGYAAGDAVITATATHGATATCHVHVYEVPATEIALVDTSIELKLRTGQNVLQSVLPDNTTDILSWESSDSDIVSVDDYGYIYGYAAGDAVVTATATHGATATCYVHVYEVPVTEITLTAAEVELESGYGQNIIQSVLPTDTTDTLKWESSNAEIATVDNGYVYGQLAGRAVITAAASSGVTASCIVYVKPKNEIVVSSVEDLHSGDEQECGYENNANDLWTYTDSGATKLNVIFNEKCALESEYDYIYIQDKNMNILGKYTGEELANAEISVPGDTVRIILTSDGSQTRYGFKVDRIEAEKRTTPIDPTPIDPTPAKPVPTNPILPKPIPRIKLNATSIPLKIKQSTKLVKVIDMLEGDSIVSWTSSKPAVAKVTPEGKITGKKKGTAEITVTLKSGVSATVKVKVQKGTVKTKKITVTGEGLQAKKVTLAKGTKFKLNTLLTPLTSQQKVKYTSSAKKIAAVSAKGVISAKKRGTAKITVKSGSKKYVIKVTVK